MSRLVALLLAVLLAALPAAGTVGASTGEGDGRVEASSVHRHGCPDDQRASPCEVRAVVTEGPMVLQPRGGGVSTASRTVAAWRGTDPAPDPGPPRHVA